MDTFIADARIDPAPYVPPECVPNILSAIYDAWRLYKLNNPARTPSHISLLGTFRKSTDAQVNSFSSYTMYVVFHDYDDDWLIDNEGAVHASDELRIRLRDEMRTISRHKYRSKLLSRGAAAGAAGAAAPVVQNANWGEASCKLAATHFDDVDHVHTDSIFAGLIHHGAFVNGCMIYFDSRGDATRLVNWFENLNDDQIGF